MAGFEQLVSLLSDLIWKTLPGSLGLPHTLGIILIATLGGTLLGLTIHIWGSPTVNLEHTLRQLTKNGYGDDSALPLIFLQGLISLGFGASLGPEGPLTSLTAGLGTWLGRRSGAQPQALGLLSFAAVSGVLGSFFRSPYGSALIVLETPHEHSLATNLRLLIPGTLAATAGLTVFSLLQGHFLGHEYVLTEKVAVYPYLVVAPLLGLLGGLLALGFRQLRRQVELRLQPLAAYPVAKAILGGVCLGGLIALAPLVQGRGQVDALLDPAAEWTVLGLLGLVLVKLLATALCIETGYKGGVIFPLLFSGATLAVAITKLFPMLPLGASIPCLTVATLTGFMGAPIGPVLMVGSAFPPEVMPLTALASIFSYLVCVQGQNRDVPPATDS